MSTGHEAASGLQRALAVIRRRILIVVLVPIVAIAAAIGISELQNKEYTANSSLLFNGQNAAQQAAGITSPGTNDPTGQRATNLLLVQLTDAEVSKRVAAALGFGITSKQIEGAVTATQAGASNIVSLSATWPDPRVAARLANLYAQAFISLQHSADEGTVQRAIELVQSQFGALTSVQKSTPQGQSLLDRLESLKVVKALQNNISVVQAATVPTSPSSPKISRNVILGTVLGIFLAIALAFQVDGLDQRFREPSEIEQKFGLPLLGVVPHGVGRPAKRPAKGWQAELEPFRMLRAHLRYFNVDRDLQTLLVVSAAPSEGKTTVAYGLAAGAASMGTTTLLIEADLRNPVIERMLGLVPGSGLTGALIGSRGLHPAVRNVKVSEGSNGAAEDRWLDLIPAGAVPPNPTEMLESQALDSALDWARERYELVIIDSAPLSIVPDSIALAKKVDGVVVVSRLRQSRRDAADRLREQLESLDAPAIGVVVNDHRARASSYYGYQYGSSSLNETRPAAEPEPNAAPEPNTAPDPNSAAITE